MNFLDQNALVQLSAVHACDIYIYIWLSHKQWLQAVLDVLYMFVHIYVHGLSYGMKISIVHNI